MLKKIYPRNVYQIQETLFDKLNAFGTKYTSQREIFKNIAIFHFESICAHEEKFKGTKTTTWIGKHVPNSVYISSNLVEEPVFLRNSNS